MKKLYIFLVLLLIPINIYAISDTAKSTIVMDMSSKRVLYQKNADEPRLIASITKIMTAVIAIEEGNENDIITVGDEVLSMYGSNIYLEIGEEISLKNLLYGLLLRSGNDAAIVISKHIGGTEEKFVDYMNKKAKQLGMKNTVFKNSHGLDENTKNYSTARDMALLSSYANSLPLYRQISGTKKWTVSSNKKSYVWNNRNKLLYSYEYATGGKTGYTPSAGRTLVTTASKDNLNLTIVTLDDSNEYNTHESLYEYCFNKYKKYLIINKNDLINSKVFTKDSIYIKEDFYYPLTESEKEKIETKIKITRTNNYKNNEKIGDYIVYLDSKEIYRDNIYVKIKKSSRKFILKRIKEILISIFK